MAVFLVKDSAGDSLICSGASDARDMLVNVDVLVKTGVQQHGDFSTQEIADLIELALSGSASHRRGVVLALADFIGSAMDGSAPELSSWNPMERVPRPD